MATPPIPWDKIIQYGPAVAEMATKAWSRAARWRQAGAKAEGSPPGSGGAETLGEAVADQATLSREIAEQLKGVTAAVAELSARMERMQQAQEARERLVEEQLTALARRAKLAFGLAIAGLVAWAVLAGLLIARVA